MEEKINNVVTQLSILRLQKKQRQEMLREQHLLQDYQWCEREADRHKEFSRAEREVYRNALFEAVKWGKSI